jgi:bifunctional DNase/RNase
MNSIAARRICLPFLLIAMAACACARNGMTSARSDPGAGEVKVEVTSVGLDHDTGTHYVMLEDLGHQRAVPILVGDNEAEVITLQMHGLRAPRPLTQDLLRNVIEQTGNHVDRVVITEVRNEVYLAKIVLDGGRHKVDSRPSDAIALAMGTHAPIYVNEKLLTPDSELGELGMSVAMKGVPKTERGLGIAVQELTPTLASYFEVPPKSAVLVDEVGPNATRAGMKRGDLLTSIDGKTIAGVTDFDREVASLKEGRPIVLTIRRGRREQSVTLKP